MAWVVSRGLGRLIGGWGWFRVAGWSWFTLDDWVIDWAVCIFLVSHVVITKKHNFKLRLRNTFYLIAIYKLSLQKN